MIHDSQWGTFIVSYAIIPLNKIIKDLLIYKTHDLGMFQVIPNVQYPSSIWYARGFGSEFQYVIIDSRWLWRSTTTYWDVDVTHWGNLNQIQLNTHNEETNKENNRVKPWGMRKEGIMKNMVKNKRYREKKR